MAARLAGDVFAIDVERAPGLPEAEKYDEDDDGGRGRDDGNEPRAARDGHEVLGDGEGGAGGEDRRPDFDHGAKAGVGPDEPEGNEEIEGHEDDGGGAGESEQIEAGDAVEGDDGNAHASEGDGGGVGEKRQAGGLQRTEAETDENGGADGDRSAEAGGALKERAQREGDEEKLQAAVGGDAGEALLESDEAAGLDGEVVEKDDGKNDPADGKEAVARAVGRGGEGEPRGHVKDEHGGEQCGGETGERGDVRLEAQNGHGAEKDNDGQCGDECGKNQAAGGVVALRPVEGGGIGQEKDDEGGDEGKKGEGLDEERGGVRGLRRRRLHGRIFRGGHGKAEDSTAVGASGFAACTSRRTVRTVMSSCWPKDLAASAR